MEITVISSFCFIIVMTLILSKMRNAKIKAIAGFFSMVLPKIPLVGMIKAYWESKNKDAEKDKP